MAREGHNGPPLTDEEQDALATHYALRIIAQQKVVALKKAELDGERSKVNGFFKLIAKDLKITRQDFERDVIDVMGKTEAEYLSAEKKRQRLHQMAGAKPIGAQLDIEDRIADTVDDAIAAEADGYRAGRRADDPVAPENIATMFHTDWQRGWVRGQEVNAKAEAMAAEILARPKPGEMAAAPEDEAEDNLDGEVERLEKAGWVQPTAEEAEFIEADNGRTIRAA
jgi:hypothetical protein